MNRILSLFAGLCISASAAAMPSGEGDGKKFLEGELEPLTPTYIDDVFQDSGWDSNWFLSVKGGFSSFNGNPVGCGDFFDRSRFMVNVGIGKWFTPKVGGRIAFQGLSITDSELSKCDFQSVHADFLYNIASVIATSDGELPRWGIIPYLGCGIVHNDCSGKKPFGISFGIIGQYALNDRLAVSAEIGNTTTLGDFDGIGDGSRFKDNIFQASVGLTVNIGKKGWKRVIDAKPYIYQNDILIRKLQELYAAGAQHNLGTDLKGEISCTNARNNYSGLNSLRMRMAKEELASLSIADTAENGGADSIQYLNEMRNGNCIGSPFMFFFKINSTQLTDPSQVININMMAKVINKYRLKVKIYGAADSKTGRQKANMKLSQKRGEYLGRLLQQRGIPEEDIELISRGGIDKYDPYWANRHTCIMLFLK